MSAKNHFTFTIDTWDDAGNNPIEHLAGLDDYRMAIAAYEAAVRNKPGFKIMLRQGIRVVRKNWEVPPAETGVHGVTPPGAQTAPAR